MAVYPVQAGNPDYSSTGTNAFIPAIYSALLVKKFYPETVFSKISNTDYEGDIKSQGDTVNIRTRPTIETFRYKKGMVLPVQNPESPYIQLKIDQGEGFSFALDKVDEFQADIKLMNVWGEDAGKQMSQVIDRNVLVTLAAKGADLGAGVYTNISGYVANQGPDLSTMSLGTSSAAGSMVAGGYTVKGTAITAGATSGSTLGQSDAQANMVVCGNSTQIVNQILFYGRLMNENNAPADGRFVILPAYYYQLLKDISVPFGQAYATGQNMANVLTGNVPKIDGFEVMFSNNLPILSTGALQANEASPIVFGHKYATTFATQITESRIIDNPFAFGKMMQGLQVYGFNVIKPQFIGVDFWKKA
jgi:hypothetical protein